MGNTYDNQQRYDVSVSQIPSHEVWLQNQTFRIKGQFYTLFERRRSEIHGSVWASITPDGRYAAVKVFNLGRRTKNNKLPSLATSFQDEVRMAYRLRDAKHVVNIYGFDFDLKRHVALIAMELGDDSLEDRVKNLHMTHSGYARSKTIDHDYISPNDRKKIWIQLVKIVLTLNQHNVVHRNIKPANLVFFGPILKIVDFGIAKKVLVGDKTQKLDGTPFYSAPECLRGKASVTSKADIWSAGAILYYLTYGQAPQSWTSQSPHGIPQTRSTLVQDVLDHCLVRNPNQRASHQWLARHPLTASPALA